MFRRATTFSVVAAVVATTTIAWSPAGAEPGWISGTSTLSTSLSASSYDVVLDAAGTATAAWVEAAGGTFVLLASRRTAGGEWSRPVAVDSGSATQDAEPQVAADGHGRVVAVWRDYTPSRTGSVIRTATFDGSSWSTSEDLSPATTHAFEPQVAVDERGDAVVLWTENVSGGSSVVRAAYRRAAGRWVTSGVTSSPGGAGAQVAIDPDGRAVGVWVQDGQVQTSDRGPTGSWSPPRTLSTRPDALDPRVAVDADGRTVVVWRATGFRDGLSGIQAATRGQGADWSPTSDLVVTPDGGAWQLSLGVDASGDALAAWSVSSDGNRRSTVYTAVREPGGEWAVEAIDGPAAYDSSPTIGFGVGRSSVVVWTGSTEQLAMTRTLYATTHTAGHGWSEPTELAAGAIAAPVVSVDREGHGTLLWTQSSTTLTSRVFDGVAPSIDTVKAPSLADVGAVARYAGSASDAWSDVSVSWTFDDRKAVRRERVTRRYGAPGVHRARFLAADRAGNRAARRVTTVVSAHRPRVRDLRITSQAVRFQLSAPAWVRLRLYDRRTERVALRLVKALDSGRVTLRLGSHELAAHRYDVRVAARNVHGSGNASTTVRIRD